MTMTMYLYTRGFRELKMGYASAIGYSLAVIILVLERDPTRVDPRLPRGLRRMRLATSHPAAAAERKSLYTKLIEATVLSTPSSSSSRC